MLDNESTTEDKAYILQHIEGCYRCFDNHGVEQAIRELLIQRNSNIEVPQEVVDQILAKIEVH